MNKVSTTYKDPDARYFVFEGADGTGKTTQAGMLAKHLESLLGTERVLLTSQPWLEGRYGRFISKLLPRKSHLKGAELLQLYVDNCMHHLTNIVIPALEQGKVVVQDQSYYRTLAYQSTQGTSIESIVVAHKDMEVADQVFILRRSGIPDEQREIAEHFNQMGTCFPEHPLSFIDVEGTAYEVHGLVKQVLQSDVKHLLSTIPLLVVQNRIFDALQKSGRGGVMREVAKWRGDDRYGIIIHQVACILGQHGLSP